MEFIPCDFFAVAGQWIVAKAFTYRYS